MIRRHRYSMPLRRSPQLKGFLRLRTPVLVCRFHQPDTGSQTYYCHNCQIINPADTQCKQRPCHPANRKSPRIVAQNIFHAKRFEFNRESTCKSCLQRRSFLTKLQIFGCLQGLDSTDTTIKYSVLPRLEIPLLRLGTV